MLISRRKASPQRGKVPVGAMHLMFLLTAMLEMLDGSASAANVRYTITIGHSVWAHARQQIILLWPCCRSTTS